MKPGIEYIRTLSEVEKEFIQQVYDDCKHNVPIDYAEVAWLNLYVRKEFTQGINWIYNESLHSFVCNLIEDSYKDSPEHFPEKHILSYGFIVNPAESKKVQRFHVDYSYTSSNLFIPLTKVSLYNAPQFIKTELKMASVDENNYFGATPEDIMEIEGIDVLEVAQVISKPWTVLRLNPGTPHRRIANSENYDRVMLFVTIDRFYKELEESITYVESLEIDG